MRTVSGPLTAATAFKCCPDRYAHLERARACTHTHTHTHPTPPLPFLFVHTNTYSSSAQLSSEYPQERDLPPPPSPPPPPTYICLLYLRLLHVRSLGAGTHLKNYADIEWERVHVGVVGRVEGERREEVVGSTTKEGGVRYGD